jgi:O-antigen/teichoic acid export membrane protein
MGSRVGARKIFSALGYNVLAVIPTQGLGLLRGIILARLLPQEAFGLFGIAWMTVEAFTTMSNFNSKNLLITLPIDQDGLKRHWLDSLWVMETLRGALILMLVSGCASLISNLYESPDLKPMLIMAGVAVFLTGFTNSGFTLYEREIEYKTVVIVEQLAAITGFCVTIGLAYWWRDATAFIWGLIATSLVKVMLSFAWHPYRPQWRVDWEVFKKGLGYGKYFIIISGLTYATTQFDNLVLGKYMGLAALGIYLMCYKLAMMPVDLMTQVVSRVALPAYATLYRNDPRDCFDKWSTNFICLSWLFAASSIGLWVGGDYLISIVYGYDWVPPVGVFSLLVCAGLLRGLTHISVSMILAMNRPDIDAKAKTVETIVFVVLVLLLIPHFGMLGAAVAGLVCYGVALVSRTGFLLHQRREVRSKMAGGLARGLLGAAIIFVTLQLLEGLGIPVVIRLGLGLLLVPCVGLMFEPLLRDNVRRYFLSRSPSCAQRS